VALAGWIVFTLSRSRSAALLFALGSTLLVALFAFVYGGDVRHHGFLFVLLLMSAWIAAGEARSADAGDGADLRRSACAATLTAVLGLHCVGTPIALYFDAKYVFSSGRRAAEALREHGLADSLLVAEIDFPATAVIGYLGRNAFAYTPRTGRRFSFVKWTRDRRWDPTDQQTIRFAAELGARQGEDATLIMNRPLQPELVDGKAVRPVAELYDSMIEEENFYLYRVAR
jgi:hypothetical protein